MYDQIREDTLYIMLYAAVTAMAMIASCYLLFRDGNAFAANIKTPLRLRRWVAAFFASIALNHVWYMPIFFLSSSEDIMLCDLVGGLLDCMTLFPLAIIVLLAMLQDRRRPLWPAFVMMAPIVAGMVWSIVIRSYAALQPAAYIYLLLMCISLIIYMVRASKQYGRWLRDNYADLEYKEIWQSFLVLSIILLVFVSYASVSEGTFYLYAMQVILVVLICYLLWRAETLCDLSIPVNDTTEEMVTTEHEKDKTFTLSIRSNIGPLLKKYCEDAQLYLQYDISADQLSKLIGINRLYLSKYFATQGITYNAYINGLRIQHFINLYHKSATSHQPMIAKQLAYQSGFRSYSTFSAAFKQIMGMTATEWMHNNAK